MSDQTTPDTPAPTPEPEGATTAYVVLMVCGTVDAEALPEGASRDLWREVGVLDVPQRTQRATVLQRAGELVREAAEESCVRFRVWPLDQQSEGEATLVRPEPQLEVRVL